MRGHFDSIHNSFKRFPTQFWLILGGMLLAETGSSLIWPFMAIYIHSTLEIPLVVVASLMTITSITTLVSSFITGPLTDRFGRKGMMVTGLAVNACIFIFMALTQNLAGWAVIMFLRGIFLPVYRIGADAMVADLTNPGNRPEAYSLIRMVGNAGIAIGPSIGGFLAARSYVTSFLSAAIAFLIFSLLILFLARETLPKRMTLHNEKYLTGGFAPALRNRPFLAMVGTYTLTIMGNAVVMLLLSVYAKENFNIPESQYGFIMATNALMVVFLQYPVTSVTKKYPPLPVLIVGALFYTFGIGGVAAGSTFWGFWLCMVTLTIGELFMSPTITTLVANIAPPEMRGRYMSIFGLTWGLGVGVGPVIAGFFSDHFFPSAMWYVGAIFALFSVAGFLILHQINQKKHFFV